MRLKPNSPDQVSQEEKDQAALERKKARQEASAAARRNFGPAPKNRLAFDKARTRHLFDLYKNKGDREARNELIASHSNLVRFLAIKFVNRGEDLDDLIQVGTIGLINAIDRFDPSLGYEFTTFATPYISGEIKKYFRDKGWTVRVSRRLQELSAKIPQATDELIVELQRSPSIEEIAAHLGVSVDEVLEASESSNAYSSISLDSASSDDEDAPTLMDRYAVRDERLEGLDNHMVLQDAIKNLSPREQEVLRMRYTDDMNQVEIAEKLGVSQVQVSRLLRRTVEKLRNEFGPEGSN